MFFRKLSHSESNLYELLHSSAVALVRKHWLVEHYETQTICRRQSLPAGALMDTNAAACLADVECGVLMGNAE